MARLTFGISTLPLLLLVGAFTPSCGDDAADACAAGAECTNGQGGEGGAGGQGGQGGQMAEGSCVPWENAAGVGVPSSCGTFVSSSAGAGGDGSLGSPYATLTAALAASQSGASLYLCNETFEENITIPSGVTIYGGLDCADAWSFTEGSQTLLAGLPNTPTARFSDGAATTTLYDLQLSAAHATDIGADSIAVLVEGGTVLLERVDVTAGDGAAGRVGTTPTADIGPTDPDALSIKGEGPLSFTEGCTTAMNNAGGLQINNNCVSSSGARGGHGQVDGVSAATAGGDGSPGGGSGGQPSGGGVVACGASGCSCEAGGAGTGGAAGREGVHGVGATGVGYLTVAGWTGPFGTSGESGNPGRGGGGGAGANSGPSSSCGLAGNGGGAGGCGGNGGAIGQPGGASFAAVVLAGIFSTTAGSLTSGAGGAGGDGADGQAGAIGGNGGTGGACAGGVGGTGGQGGDGGGGPGGHSIVIAHTSAATVNLGTDTTFMLGLGGIAGAGGDSVGNGEPGLAEQVYELPTQ